MDPAARRPDDRDGAPVAAALIDAALSTWRLDGVIIGAGEVTIKKLFVFVTIAGALLSCGDSDGASLSDASGAQGQTACEDSQGVATLLGCPGECAELRPDCDDEAKAWIACLRQDLSQCMCEEDGDLNCEGSYKPNEGPARCIPHFTAFRDCDQS